MSSTMNNHGVVQQQQISSSTTSSSTTSTTSSSKTSVSKKSSSKSVVSSSFSQQTSTVTVEQQQSAALSSISSSSGVAVEQNHHSQDKMIECASNVVNEQVSSGAATKEKKSSSGGGTKVERKSSKAGSGKKSSKSNAEISKENISVPLTFNGTSSSSSLSSTNTQQQQECSMLNNLNNAINSNNKKTTTTSINNHSNNQTLLVPDELVKKLGPGESRVFAKVCVANLRRSFGDLTVISSSNNNDLIPATTSTTTTTTTYSNSLEYNNRVLSSRELKYNLKNSRIGPSSLPSSFVASTSFGSYSNLYHHQHQQLYQHHYRHHQHGNMNINNNNNNNSNKLQLFQPAYWEGLLSSSTSGHANCINKKSSFSKFDSLVSKNNNQHAAAENKEATSAVQQQQQQQDVKPEPKKMYCASCEKQVFQMELIRAEKKDWHKNCFRCVTCRKVLSVDTYQSHESRLYCKPHFKELFQPKAVVDDENGKEQEQETKIKPKLQLIICESQPKELPPDVVRASDTPSTGLEDIQIDVRSKFEMFEGLKEKSNGSKSPVLDNNLPVKRSASVLAKLKKYENSLGAAELNGVTDEDLNGVEGIELQSDEEEVEDDGTNSVIKDEIKRKLKNPLQALNEIAHFKQMEQVRSKWEEGTFTRDQVNADSRKEELQKFRSRLCQGKSGQLKELYEKGLEPSESVSSARQAEIEELKSERARAFREMFEKGEIIRVDDDDEGEEGGGGSEVVRADGNKKGVDLEVFEAGVARESKKIFEELDKRIASEQLEVRKNERVVNKIKPSGSFANAATSLAAVGVGEIVRSSDRADEPIQVNTAELSNKFKFFETYEDELARKKREGKRDTFKRITPPREDGVVKTEKDYEDSPDSAYRDPTVVRHGEVQEDDTLVKSKTTSKMLSVFRQMEENLSKGEGNKDPIIRPLKQFTPPRDTAGPGINDSEDEEDEEEEEEEDVEQEDDDDNNENGEGGQGRVMGEDEFLKEVGSLARARSLRAKFERWEHQENERNKQQGIVAQDELADSIESAKNLKAKFEAMRLMENAGVAGGVVGGGGSSNNKENKRSPVPIRINRFVLNNHASPELISSSSASTSPSHFSGFNSLPAESTHSPVLIMSSGNEQCAMCEKRVYAMEKIEAGGKMYHKNCFRCSQCKSILRMDTFTSNKGTLFCTTHFKQLFKIKGNYDEGFGHETQYQVWAKKQAAAQQN